MVALKMLMAIALVMISTFNSPCSADLEGECQSIIISTFYEELGEVVRPFCGTQCFNVMYNKLTKEHIKKNFYNSSSSTLDNYDRDLKIELMLDYFNNIYTMDYEMEEYLKYIEMETPTVWCTNKSIQFNDHSDGTPCPDKYNACMETSTVQDIFKEFYDNWTAETLQLESIYEIPDGESLDTPEYKTKRFFIEKFLHNYYTFISEKLSLIDHYNYYLRVNSDREVHILTVEEYCERIGHSILNK